MAVVNGADIIREGMVLSGCRITAKIGEGGMGAVYKAVDENLERIVAVKVMNPEGQAPELVERFRREAQSVAKLSHPGVAQVYAAGEIEGALYYIMEFVDGKSLDSFIKKARIVTGGKLDVQELIKAGYISEPDPAMPYFLRDLVRSPLSDPRHIEEAKTLVACVAETLSAVHKSGAVHRDIKPSNIVVSKKGEIKLVDFGLVKRQMDGSVTKMNHFVGTLDYMAPEQFLGRKGEITPATDIYGLGVVFYELATLRKPVEEDEVAALINAVTSGRIEDPRAHNPELPAGISDIIMRCLAKAPTERFESGDALAAAIRAAGTPAPVMSNIRKFFFGLLGSAFGKGRGHGEAAAGAGALIEKADGTAETGPDRRDGAAHNAHGGNGTAAGRNEAGEVLKLSSITVSREAADAARALFEEARDEYFDKFLADRISDRLGQCLDLDPGNTDALLLLYLLVKHGVCGIETFEARWKRSRAAKKTDDHEMAYAVIEALHERHDPKAAGNAGEIYRRLHPDDLLMAILMCDIEAELGDLQKVLEFCDMILSRHPDFIITQLYSADIRAALGDLDGCMEILARVKAKNPENQGYKIVALQNLIMSNRLDEAERTIGELLDADPADEVAINMKPRLSIYRGKTAEAAGNIRRLIGLDENPETKAYLYYMLYRIYVESGNDEKAAEYLRMANRTSARTRFFSVDDIRDTIESAPLAAMAPDGIVSREFAPYAAFAKKVCLKILSPLTFSKFSNLSTTSCYHYRSGGRFERFVIYSSLRYIAEPSFRAQVYLSEMPASPFTGSGGEILDASIRKCRTPYGEFTAVVNYPAPHKSGEPMFFMTCFDAASAAKENGGAYAFGTDGHEFWNTIHNGIVVSVPAGTTVSCVSEKPYRIEEIEGRVYYHFMKFVFKGERYSIKMTVAE